MDYANDPLLPLILGKIKENVQKLNNLTPE
jgi:hypothetical protein